MTDTAWILDFDNHYYESEDAFTRHQDTRLRSRGVRWADIDGRRRLLVGGKLNSYIANPTFDPVAKPGALYDWYRGNPRRQGIVEAFGELEPIRPEYRDRDVRLKVMDEQRVAATLLFPTLGVGLEDALRDDPEAAVAAFTAFNRWLDEDWGYAYEGRIFAVPYIQMLDPASAARELRTVLDDAANRNPGYFPQHPSETFGEHVWVTPFWEDHVPQIAEAFRVDRLLLGSDWPHAEGTRTPYEFVTETLVGLSDDAVRLISRDNAADLLGLSLA